MKPKTRLILKWYGLNATMLALGFTLVIGAFYSLPTEQSHLLLDLLYQYRLAVGAFLLAGLVVWGWGTQWMLEQVWLPLHRLKEQVQAFNPQDHNGPFSENGNPLLQTILQTWNQKIVAINQSRDAVEQRIQGSNRQLKQEHHAFELLIESLQSSVIVCNFRGEVVLYNQSAKNLLGSCDASMPHYIGLGRKIEKILPNPLFQKLIARCQVVDHQNTSDQHEHLVFKQGERLLKAQIIHLKDQENFRGGILVIIQKLGDSPDSTAWIAREAQLLENLRHPVANVRSSFEMLYDFPEMPADKQRNFQSNILSSLNHLTELLNTHQQAPVELSSTHLNKSKVEIRSWMSQQLQEMEPDSSESFEINENYYVLINPHLMELAFAHLLDYLREQLGDTPIGYRLFQKGSLVCTEWRWQNVVFDHHSLRSWLTEKHVTPLQSRPVAILEILVSHDVELWMGRDTVTDDSFLRLSWPLCDPPESRPVRGSAQFPLPQYDWSLLFSESVDAALLDMPLEQLYYSVFDTETTGLVPSQDEILSIGAIRIINRKLLNGESFNELVNPQCSIPPASTRIHGITQKAVDDKPTVNQILPQFYHFVENTTLIGHNVAFDLAFLKKYESQTGVVFDHPVLDTLLLSAVIAPLEENHGLDALAERFGLPCVNRHNALGDALLTGQVFLKLIPLLHQQKIYTLREAQAASKQTSYARIAYN